jgi:uncharacterized protein YggE
MNEQNITKVVKGVLITLGFLSLFLLISTIAKWDSLSDNNMAFNTINVAGTGEVIVIPDVAVFSFTVTETSETVDTAQSLATSKINKALDALKAAGVEEKDLKTESYNIYPEYKWNQGICYMGSCPDGREELVGYTVSQTTQVKVRDTKKAGEMLTLVGANGISNVSGLQFTLDDADSAKEEARSKAIADARVKAKKLAKDLGVDLGDVVSYYEDGPGGYPMYDDAMYMSAKMESASMAPQLPAGENTVISNVTVTFEIED